MVDNSRTVDVVNFDWVQLVPKDSYTRRLLRFNIVDVSSVSSDSNATPLGLVARRSYFVLDKLTKGYWYSLSDMFLWHPGHVHRVER